MPDGTAAFANAVAGQAPPAPVPGVPPGYPPGAWPITLPPGTTIQLGNGTMMTFPGGVMLIASPVDGGIWIMPRGQPGVVQFPTAPNGTGGGSVPILLGTTFPRPPVGRPATPPGYPPYPQRIPAGPRVGPWVTPDRGPGVCPDYPTIPPLPGTNPIRPGLQTPRMPPIDRRHN